MRKYTELDLDALIDNKISNCDDLPNICDMKETEHGKERIFKLVKRLIMDEGIYDIDAALAQVESQLNFSS